MEYFTGLGGTIINPSVTNGQINTENVGVVWSKGFEGIFAISSFYDLLESNKKSGFINVELG